MIEQIILGIIQGITEWLPISSQGVIILVKTNFFGSHGIESAIKDALCLHLGTFLAALIYFRKDVTRLMQTVLNYKSMDQATHKIFKFLLISTLISGLLGICLLKMFTEFVDQFNTKSQFITLAIGFLLIGTAFLEIKAKNKGFKEPQDLRLIDGIILGIAQGFAALPGLSRSGLTISSLLLRKFEKTIALKLSFLMSLPIVLLGNIVLNLKEGIFKIETFIGMFFSFIVGLLTIHLLLKLAHKINFGYFVLFFGILTIASAMI